MKKLIFIVLAIALFAACSKKQSPGPVITLTPQNATIKDVAGNWLVTADSIFTITNGKTSVIVQPNIYNSSFKFNADGTGTLLDNGVTTNFTFTVTSGAVAIHKAANGNQPAQDESFTIHLITADQLILRTTSGTSYGDLVFVKN